MKLKSILLILLLSPLFLTAQNLPACDSVFIDCCTFNSPTENTISILVSNYSSDIFSYPGFILFSEGMDTMAIETVNYFGISWNQTHILNIINPFNLPFEGILELHTGFYEMKACTFTLAIPDTTLTQVINADFEPIRVYPNPTSAKLNIDIDNSEAIDQILITDVNGHVYSELKNPERNTINVSNLTAGIYFVVIYLNERTIRRTKFIKSD